MFNMTKEQRAESLAKAQAARTERRAEMIANQHLLKQDFADRPHWQRLASAFGVRMPSDYVPGTESKAVRKAMRKCGVTPAQVREAFGCDVGTFARHNPAWPAFAIVGLILEIANETLR